MPNRTCQQGRQFNHKVTLPDTPATKHGLGHGNLLISQLFFSNIELRCGLSWADPGGGSGSPHRAGTAKSADPSSPKGNNFPVKLRSHSCARSRPASWQGPMMNAKLL
jgi:hypothetical protein